MLEFTDNRLSGLLREVEAAIEETDDPATLWRLGVALKLLADKSRGRGYDINPNKANRSW